MASRTIAYILLFTLGLLGAHQFYLGRSLHGFSEDQFLTEEYQADLSRFTSVQQILQSAPAPGQPETQDRGRLRDDYEALKRRLAGSIFFRDKLRDKAPRCSWSRYFGEILFGLTCAMLWLGAFPTEWFDDDNRKQLIRLTWPLPIALGESAFEFCLALA
uniref:TM2 domain-containing protein n=1 Tax=Macrostomum lignano TaxID=282301 RepID=A0A1I8FNI0_9PLAT